MNILIIVCDTLRADHLGCYGYFRDTSPYIDRIAGDGVVFEDFFSAGCPTGPGFTGIITGLHTIHHKFYRFGEPNIRQVDDTLFTMAEILRAMDFTTVAFDNLMNQGARAKHFVRGYEFYVNCGPDVFGNARCLRAEQLNRRLLRWIRTYSNERFFLFVHYWDPHCPYNQPEEYRNLFHHEKGDLSDLEVREARAGYKYVPGWGKIDEMVEGTWHGRDRSIDLYDGEISCMDHHIGEVLEALEDILDETLVIITSDHGEQLGQHRGYGWGHGGLHDACTHLPLIMRHPKKLPKGIRVSGFCQQIDILPTILDLLDVRTDILQIDGKSLLPLTKGEKIRDQIFMEHSSGQRSVRTGELQLLDDEVLDDRWAGRPSRELELYNVKEDPMEVINLAESDIRTVAELRETLRAWVRANIEEGETDPAIYEDWRQLNMRNMNYGKKVRQLLASIKTET